MTLPARRRDSITEAEKLRAEIAEAETKVKTLKGQIRHRQGRLRRIAADAFNEEANDLDGSLVEVREIVLGVDLCDVSPIGICVYADVISLPGQRRDAAELATLEHAGPVETWSPVWYTNACLFCGKKHPR